MRTTVVAIVGAVVLGLTPAVGVAAPRVPTPGSAGIGDPYWPTDGNGGYDVQHYDLRLDYRPATDVLTGVANLRIRATQDLSRFDLDLDGLRVDTVRVDRRRATWTRAADELKITPARSLRRGETFTVTVGYHGVPKMVDDEFGESGFYTTGDGAVVAGQPHVADTWFPSNDHPLDKATYRISITAPRNLQVISNGGLRSVAGRGGSRTWTWKMNKPMASYLATMAIGKFQVRRYFSGGLEYVDAIDPALFGQNSGGPGGTVGDRAKAALRKEPAIIRFLSGVLGPYPFGQVGGIVDDARIGFALENQTRPIYDPVFFKGPDQANDDLVVVHELAHQWAGDSLALSRWSDIWLNEGFATYAEWLWSQAQGRKTIDESFAEYARIAADDEFWDLAIAHPGAEHIFDDPTYYRGAMTLRALQKLIGDAKFNQLVKAWFRNHAQGNVSTAGFIALAERISGRDLDRFFADWVYSTDKPEELSVYTGARNSAARSAGDARPLRPHRR